MTSEKKLPPLVIGNLKIPIPIIQGGMGIRISTAPLVSAVSNNGGMGILASVTLGESEPDFKTNYVEANSRALRKEIKKIKEMTDRPFGVNIMCMLSDYESLVEVCKEEKIAAIFSGAGLPSNLPELLDGIDIKKVPIVSSAKAANLICKIWDKKYSTIPDALVVEGPKAGGHLGFKMEQLNQYNDDDEKGTSAIDLDNILKDVLEIIIKFEEKYNRKIPVIAAGGIFTGKDIARVMNFGVSGVQMGTRFVCTVECDVSDTFKQTYINSSKEDIKIIMSPLGYPGRVILNPFMKRVLEIDKIKTACSFRCIKNCKADKVNFCIAKALLAAQKGNMEDGLVFCGENAHRVTEILTVPALMQELVNEAEIFYKHKPEKSLYRDTIK